MTIILRAARLTGVATAIWASPVSAQTPPAQAAAAEAAQESAPDGVVGAGDIIVTAQKRSESINTVPMSINAASGEQLQNLGITGVQDLGKLVPGFNYIESGAAVPVYSLRGVGFFDVSIGARPSVAVYQDESALPFSIMTQGASFDLERVEVLKGPQGTLFGQNATGGAINFVAAKPTDTFKTGGEIGFGRFNALDAQAYVSGPLSDTLTARIAVKSSLSDGWQRSYTRDDTLGARRETQARLQLRWQPTERLTANLMLAGFVDRSDTQAGQLIAVVPTSPARIGSIPALVAYPLAPADARAADWDPNTEFRRDNRFYQAVARFDYDLTDDIVLTSISSAARIDVDQKPIQMAPH